MRDVVSPSQQDVWRPGIAPDPGAARHLVQAVQAWHNCSVSQLDFVAAPLIQHLLKADPLIRVQEMHLHLEPATIKMLKVHEFGCKVCI